MLKLLKRSVGRSGNPRGRFGRAFAKARKALGMTQAQAAAFFNKSRATVARWEAGGLFPDPKSSTFMARLDVFQQMANSMEME